MKKSITSCELELEYFCYSVFIHIWVHLKSQESSSISKHAYILSYYIINKHVYKDRIYDIITDIRLLIYKMKVIFEDSLFQVDSYINYFPHRLFRDICRRNQTTAEQFYYNSLLSCNACGPSLYAFEIAFCYDDMVSQFVLDILRCDRNDMRVLYGCQLDEVIHGFVADDEGGLRSGLSWRWWVWSK